MTQHSVFKETVPPWWGESTFGVILNVSVHLLILFLLILAKERFLFTEILPRIRKRKSSVQFLSKYAGDWRTYFINTITGYIVFWKVLHREFELQKWTLIYLLSEFHLVLLASNAVALFPSPRLSSLGKRGR